METFGGIKPESPRVLLTGATGFVGPCLLRSLESGPFSSAEVFSWQFDPSAENDPLLNIDIRSREAVFGSIEALQPTHIIHLAAQSHVPTSFSHPELTWDINVMGTLHLLEAVKKFVPAAGILFIGSSEVYGRSFLSGDPVDETTLLQPQNPYAASKAAADLMAGQYAAQGLRVVRIRPFNHIGPGQREDFAVSAFAAQVARIEKGLQPPVVKVGNLEAKRDFLDVRDVVRAYALALERIHELPAGLILNVCSGVPRKMSDLLQGLIAQADRPVEVTLDEKRLRPSDIPLAVGSAAEARRYLDWGPEVPLEETLTDVLDYWRVAVASECRSDR